MMLQNQTGSLRQRDEHLGQTLRQAIDMIDNRVLPAKDVLDIFVCLGVKVDAIGINVVAIELFDGLMGVLDQELGVSDIDIRRFTIGQDQHEFFVRTLCL